MFMPMQFVIRAITMNAQGEIGGQKELHFTLGKRFYQELT
jgi:hypothetical protein